MSNPVPPFGTGKNISMGSGLLYSAGRLVGYLKDIEWEFDGEIEDVRVEVPERLVWSIVKGVKHILRAKLLELTAQNVAMVIGGVSVVTNSGSSPTTVSSATNLPLTANFMGSPYLGANFAGPAVASLTVTTVTGATALASGTDYDFIAGAGFSPGTIWIRATSSHISTITSDGAVLVGYTWTQIASSQVNFGTSFPIILNQLSFIHSIPGTSGGSGVNGALIRQIVMPQYRSAAKLKTIFSDSQVQMIGFEAEAIEDDTYPTYPLGYFINEQGP